MNAGDRKNDYDTTKVYSAIKCLSAEVLYLFSVACTFCDICGTFSYSNGKFSIISNDQYPNK